MNGRTRTRVSVALLALASLLIAASVAAIYVDRNIFDSAHFADHAEAALDETAVRQVAADRLTDVVINDISPDAVAVRPLIETATDSVIASAAFGRLFRSGALQLHRAAVDGDVDGAVLTLANVGILISTGLERLNPELADQIPDSLDASLLQVAQGEGFGQFTRTARTFDEIKWLLIGASLILLIAAFAIAPQRRRSVEHLGFALLGSGTVLAVAYFAARSYTVNSVNPGEQIEVDAVTAIWEVFMEGLLNQALLLAALGVVIVAATDGALGGVRLGERIRSVGGWLAVPPERPWLRLAWSIGAVVLGALIVMNPETAAKVAAAIAGLLILSGGLQELAIMASPDGEFAAETTDKDRKVSRALIFGLAGALCIVVLASGFFRYSEGNPLEALGLTTNTKNCNGSERLCDRPFDAVTLPMTHNAMGAQNYPSWLFPTQESTIGEQLADGIRGLAVDVYYGFPGTRVFTDTDRSSPQARSVMKEEFGEEFVGAADRIRRQLSRPAGVQSELFMCHGFCELGATKLSTGMEEVADFLDANPREVMVVIFEDYVPPADLAAALEKSGVSKHAYKGPWQRPWPTLDEMIKKDQRVLLLTENGEPTVDWMNLAYDVAQETPFRFTSSAQLESRKSCLPLRGEPENSLFLVNHWVDTPPNPRPSIARRVNARDFILDRVRKCQDIRGLTANMISVDFYREGDLFGAVDTLNGVE